MAGDGQNEGNGSKKANAEMTRAGSVGKMNGGGKGKDAGGDAHNGLQVRKISGNDIQLVQNLIERCLQLYMDMGEVVKTLQTQAGIEPGFTSLVWQKLEEQNPEFFTAYKMRLRLQDQIRTFNQLLEQHMQMSNQSRATQLNAAYGWGARKMPAGARSGVSPGIPSSYNYMMGGSGISASHRGSWGHLAQLDASGMGEVRLPGSDASYMSSLAQTSSTGNLQGMMLGGAGMPMSDQMNSGYIGSFNDASNPQLPRAIPRNLSLGDMSFEMNNQSINQLSAAADDDQNALTMLGNMEAKDNSRMSLPAFDQVRDQYNGSTYKLPKNFSLSDMANFT